MLVIDQVQATRERGRESLSARIRLGDQETRLWFNWNGVACPVPGNVLVLAAIQPAMRRGYDLKIHHEISFELQGAILAIQQHFQQQAPELSMIHVSAASVEPQSPPAHPHADDQQFATGVLFDGSVDAFFTYINHQPQIQSIVYLADFEGDREIQRGKGTAIKSAELRSRELGKPLVRVETNLREFLTAFNSDEQFDEALAVAVVDGLLSGHLDKLVIPGAHDHRRVDETEEPSHLSFTSFLPSRRIYFDKPGAQIEHSTKLMTLKANSHVLEALRVCWENPRRTYNCGRCRKCTRRVSPDRLVELLSRESRLNNKRSNQDS